MRVLVIRFPGSNRDRDALETLTKICPKKPESVWHESKTLAPADLIVIPGGFSYGDYLRCGAIAAQSPVMKAVRQADEKGVLILGICNGFQILCEAGLLPGAHLPNEGLTFACKTVELEVAQTQSPFTSLYRADEIIRCPIAHHEGNYFADDETLEKLEGEGRIAFKYANGTNPNGSRRDIAGILNARKNVLGMMPHPENFIEAEQGGADGRRLFEGALNLIQSAA